MARRAAGIKFDQLRDIPAASRSGRRRLLLGESSVLSATTGRLSASPCAERRAFGKPRAIVPTGGPSERTEVAVTRKSLFDEVHSRCRE